MFVVKQPNNIVHHKDGGYDNVEQYIQSPQPNATTLAQLDELKPSKVSGDGRSTPLEVNVHSCPH